MATAMLPISEPARKQPRPGRGGFDAHGPSEKEARVRAIAEIVSSMVDLSRKGQNVDLNALKTTVCRNTQSYTGYEPTSMRAIWERYNPYVQARSRIDQLKTLDHSVDKVEFILMGGTFMSLPADYHDYFIRNLHDALSGHTSANVEEAVAYSEHGATKCIGMTIETPDYCLGPHLRQMLSYGCTRLEIGVQSTYEDVARDANRGHTVAAVADCFCLAKDAGFKVSLVPHRFWTFYIIKLTYLHHGKRKDFGPFICTVTGD
ncbi:hypothetical protein ACFX11_038984 [Malus domestica]